MTLIKTQLKVYLHQKAIIGFLVFGILPLAVLVAAIFPTELLQISGLPDGVSFLDFFGINMTMVTEMIIPLAVLSYGVGHSLRQEIDDSILYLYKDISRDKLLNAKMITLIGIIILFFGIIFFLSMGTYYFYFVNESYASGLSIPKGKDIWDPLLLIISGILTVIISLLIAIFLAIKFGNGVGIFGAMIFNAFSTITPLLTGFKWLFPYGYQALIDTLGGGVAFSSMLLLSLAYIIVFWLLARHSFRNLEF